MKEKNKQNRIFIIHRLDKDTSGVLMFAKTEEAKRAFQDNWEEIVKLRRYLAAAERAVRSGDAAQLKALLTQILSTNEGKALAEKLSRFENGK